MLYNPNKSIEAEPERAPSSSKRARRLRLEFSRLQRRLCGMAGDADPDADAARRHRDRIARELGLIRADSVHAVESKLRVALDLMGEEVEDAPYRLLASALADLHYLAVMSEPRPG